MTVSKREMYNAIINFATEGALVYTDKDGNVVTVDNDMLAAFAKREIELIDHRNEKAKERAAAKKAEADVLEDAVYDAISDEYEDAASIAERIVCPEDYDEEVTLSKVRARITKLCNKGLVEKNSIKIEKRSVMGYRRVVA